MPGETVRVRGAPGDTSLLLEDMEPIGEVEEAHDARQKVEPRQRGGGQEVWSGFLQPVAESTLKFGWLFVALGSPEGWSFLH